jgi:hypothetical protein
MVRESKLVCRGGQKETKRRQAKENRYAQHCGPRALLLFVIFDEQD